MSDVHADEMGDLARIEEALADGRVVAEDTRERELQALALTLRADSPEPAPRFAAELDRRVAAGFDRQRSRPRPRALPRAWKPVLAAAAVLLVVVAVGVGVLGGGRGSSNATSAENAAPTSGLEASSASRSAASPPPAADPRRRVERAARLTLSTPPSRLQETADGVGAVAESHGGFVLRSDVTTGDVGASGGSFVLRVPTRELEATLAGLSKLGHLRARSESAQDVTAPYRRTQDRLGNLLIERRALRLRLRREHGAVADRTRVRIARVSAQVDGLGGRIRFLHSRTAFSTVDVTLEQERGGVGGSGHGGTGAALRDSLHSLEALLNFCVRALGILLPLMLALGIAVLGGRGLRRRRREAALL